MGSFLDTLKSFGIETSLVSDGDSSILTIIGSGDSYITKSNSTTNASNVVENFSAPITIIPAINTKDLNKHQH